MAKYKYTAVGPDGLTISGVENGLSANSVRAALADRSLDVIKVDEQRSFLQFELTRKRVPRKDLMHFSRQLAAFVRAGVPILDALTTIADETANRTFQKALYAMVTSIRGGQTFADAVAEHPFVFPDIYVGIVRAAEVTGQLDTTLDRLSEYMERDLEARRKVTSALVYPTIVLLMSIGTVTLLSTFVLPRFRTFFKSFNAKLPIATRMLLAAADFITNWWFIFVAIAVILLGLGIWMRKTTTGRTFFDGMMLKLPAVSGVVQFAVLERFCRVLSSMVTAGVPLPDAMQVTSGATNNLVFRRGLEAAKAAMLRGEGLARPLAATGLFPAAARQILTVGEQTGTLDEQLVGAANYFDRELDYKIKNFTSLFEPAVIIFMGFIVGFVAIALISAMYGIFRQVNIPK